MMHFLRLVAAGAAIVYAVFFILENGGRVTVVVPLLGVRGEPYIWLFSLFLLAAGIGLGSIAPSLRLLRVRAQARRDAKRITELERELHMLRTLPLEEKRPELLTEENRTELSESKPSSME